jgi:hypothetical protein
MFVMIHSDLFIQNPESTFSKTVCIIRAVLGLQTIPLFDRIGEGDENIYTDPHHWASCSLIYHYIDTYLHNNNSTNNIYTNSTSIVYKISTLSNTKLKSFKKFKRYKPPVPMNNTNTNRYLLSIFELQQHHQKQQIRIPILSYYNIDYILGYNTNTVEILYISNISYMFLSLYIFICITILLTIFKIWVKRPL